MGFQCIPIEQIISKWQCTAKKILISLSFWLNTVKIKRGILKTGGLPAFESASAPIKQISLYFEFAIQTVVFHPCPCHQKLGYRFQNLKMHLDIPDLGSSISAFGSFSKFSKQLEIWVSAASTPVCNLQVHPIAKWGGGNGADRDSIDSVERNFVKAISSDD